MYIVTAYPLIIPFPPHSSGQFSYFAKVELRRGAIVSIPFGKRTVQAVIADCRTLAEEKARVKNQKFSLKRITKILSEKPFFTPELISLSETIADYYMTSPGALLKHFLPARLITRPPTIDSELPKRPNGMHAHQIYIGPTKERYDAYARRINDTIPHSSVLFIVPSIAMANYTKERFEDVHDVIVLHSQLGAKMLRENWQRARTGKHSFVIGTAMAIGAIPEDTGLVIVEDVHSPHFRTRFHPLFHMRNALSLLALKYEATLLEGSYTAFPEDVAYKEPRGTTITVLTPPHHVSAPTVVDMKPEITKDYFPIFSKFLIERMLRERGRTILFAHRKGYAPLVLCRDCGTTVACPSCDSPITLHNESSETKRRILKCHHCGFSSDGGVHCKHCDGWNLKSYGIGIERIIEETMRILPKRKIFRLDGDTVKDEHERKSIAKEFISSGDGILIATEMLFEEPEIEAELVGIVHIDPLFAIPDFRITEQLLRIFAALRTKGKRVVLQTHVPMHPIIDTFEKDALSRFITTELQERRAMRFPPFTVFLKCTVETRSAESAQNLAEDLARQFVTLGAKAVAVPPVGQKIQGKFHWNVQLLVPHKLWNGGDSQIHRMIRSLGREWTIAVDPASSV